jgi:hypothetical protein
MLSFRVRGIIYRMLDMSKIKLKQAYNAHLYSLINAYLCRKLLLYLKGHKYNGLGQKS